MNQREADLQKSLDVAKKEEELMNQMNQQIKEDSNELKEIHPQIVDLEKALKEVDEQILKVGGIDYKSMKDLVEKLGGQLN